MTSDNTPTMHKDKQKTRTIKLKFYLPQFYYMRTCMENSQAAQFVKPGKM